MIYRRSNGNLLLQVEKDERFRSESKKKAIFTGISFELENLGQDRTRVPNLRSEKKPGREGDL